MKSALHPRELGRTGGRSQESLEKNKKVEAESYRFRYQEKLMSALHSAVASGQFG